MHSMADYSSEFAKLHRACNNYGSRPAPDLMLGAFALLYDPSEKRQIHCKYSSPFDGPWICTKVHTATSARLLAQWLVRLTAHPRWAL